MKWKHGYHGIFQMLSKAIYHLLLPDTAPETGPKVCQWLETELLGRSCLITSVLCSVEPKFERQWEEMSGLALCEERSQ